MRQESAKVDDALELPRHLQRVVSAERKDVHPVRAKDWYVSSGHVTLLMTVVDWATATAATSAARAAMRRTDIAEASKSKSNGC